jgi:hypothetical protein
MHQREPRRPRLGARLAAFLEWGGGRDALIEFFDGVGGIHYRDVIDGCPVAQPALRDEFAPDGNDDAADNGASQCDAK